MLTKPSSSPSAVMWPILALAVVIVVASAGPAQAQAQAPTFYNMNANLIKQMAAVPIMFKQVTVIIGALTTYVGLYGFYKGAADPRSAAHVKNAFLLLIGGMLLATSFLALSAEKTVFGNNTQKPEIRGSDIMRSQMEVFR